MKAIIEIEDKDLHDAIHHAIALEMKKYDLEKIIKNAVDSRLNRLITSGIHDESLIKDIALKVAANIDIDQIKSLIDIDNLNNIVAERASRSILSKMKIL